MVIRSLWHSILSLPDLIPVSRIILLAGIILFVFILFTAPVIIYEFASCETPAFSIDAISEGSLINITEKQLIESKFLWNNNSVNRLIFYKQDSLYLHQKAVPARIEINFSTVKQEFPLFREPISIGFIYDINLDSLLAPYLGQIQYADQSQLPAGNKEIEDRINHNMYFPEGEWHYYLGDNRYFFSWCSGCRSGRSYLHTTIFSGKLFLMLKSYTIQYYSILPEIFCPDWFIRLSGYSS